MRQQQWRIEVSIGNFNFLEISDFQDKRAKFLSARFAVQTVLPAIIVVAEIYISFKETF